MTGPGCVLRTVRVDAGLSLDALAQRIYFSKGYLSKLERGQRAVTPDVIRAYLKELGEDVHRRRLLLALVAGATTPLASVESVGRAFELALDSEPLVIDEWVAKVDDYGRDYLSRAYLSFSADEFQSRLVTDLAHLQMNIDQPALASVAAQLLTIQGLTLQSTTMPPSDGSRADALRWYTLGVRAADRAGDRHVQVWTRGRAALRLAVEGAELSTAERFAREALTLSDRPSVERLSAELALALAESARGNREGAQSELATAQRTFDVIDSGFGVSDFAIPEWRMALLTSLVASRLGEERQALSAQETATRSLPSAAKYLQLHRGLVMAKSGNPRGGLAHAKATLDRLPPTDHRPAMWLLMQEIERLN